MPRPRRDGTAARKPNKKRLTDAFIKVVKPEPGRVVVYWDTLQRGLALTVQPTGQLGWKCVYTLRGRGPRWYSIGNGRAILLNDARKLAAGIMYQVAQGKDPHADRLGARGRGSFEQVAKRYVEDYARKKNKSWKQADALVTRYLLPRWAKLDIGEIRRPDVKTAFTAIAAPILANRVLAAASAIFTWAVKQEIIAANPCSGIEKNATRSCERVLLKSELPDFWQAFGESGLQGRALRVVLLTGQRPGEVTAMRREHIKDGWWEMPGDPVPSLGWPGTKNGASHRVWLPRPVCDLIASDETTGFVFSGTRLDGVMRDICKKLGVNEKVTPHDLRRTHGTTITKLGFGREAMNRVQNHREGGIADVYDRHRYQDENKRIMEKVALHIVAIAEGGGNVVTLRR